MEIAIKSEADSRMLLYPLIKALYPYGTIGVFTSNRTLTRLIDNELEGGFRNIRVVVSPEADLEAAHESDQYYKNKYDFTIYDNMGAIDYDVLICIVTNRLSESYIGDLVYIANDSKTKIIKFGSPAPTPKSQKDEEKATKKVKKAEDKTEEEIEEDRQFNKWQITKTDEDILQELLANKEYRWCKFPTFDAIELMESRHTMMVPDDTLIKELYKIFGEVISVDERQFTKGARVKDESSSTIDGTDVR